MEPTVIPDYAGPTTSASGEELPPRQPVDWLNIILQIGHRAVSLAVFVVILALAGIKTKYLDPHPLARIAFILADLACLCAVGGWYFAVVRQKPMRESLGLLIFSLLIAGASLAALLHTRT
jgi:heme A synthase